MFCLKRCLVSSSLSAPSVLAAAPLGATALRRRAQAARARPYTYRRRVCPPTIIDPVANRVPLPCRKYPPDRRPCVDMRKIIIERGTPCHEKIIRAFLYAHHWTRDPTCTGLWMSLDSPYLACITEKYATSGDRYLAFELQDRTHERKPVGVLVANKTFPWVADELDQWARHTIFKPDRTRMFFMAHCLRSANLFNRYHVPYAYEIEVLSTSEEVRGHGVGEALLRRCIKDALELRHPLIQILAKSDYVIKICERLKLKNAWSMKYADYVSETGQSLFFPRRPHFTAAMYYRVFDPKDAVPKVCPAKFKGYVDPCD
ncbi:uncharacterized protein LOC126366397 [Pectinophora gossypiella]|uniref:uncharacterized protein LOC126366397 n=1 Tax=Pectinophora gossypiella TaxID=13191 RepID=UPI00214E1679|nr:uncharacterized protein LOC126366397 [Pectinophora gossypiella]